MKQKHCNGCQTTKPADAFYMIKGGTAIDSRCKECKREAERAWRKTASGQKSRKRNKKKWEQSEAGRLYRRTGRRLERRRKNCQRYKETPLGKATAKAWRSTPKGRAVMARANAKRRAALADCRYTLTAEEWATILEAARGRCHYCRKRRKLTQDHVIPLSKGGHHEKENIVAACLPCNTKKSNKLVTLF